MPDTNPSNHNPAQPTPPVSHSWRSIRPWRVRSLGIAVLVIVVLGAVGFKALGHAVAPNGSSAGTTGTNSNKPYQFTYNNVTYQVSFTGVQLAGQSTQTANGLNINYLFTYTPQANLTQSPSAFTVTAAVPKSETQNCGVVPSPSSTDAFGTIGDYFMPLSGKSGWCQEYWGQDNQGDNPTVPGDTQGASYDAQSVQFQLTNLTAPVARTNFVLVVTSTQQPTKQWIIPYTGD